MKNLILIIALCFAYTVNAQEIKWVSLEDAVKLQQQNPKKIMIDMYTVWCGPCKMLDRNTFHNKDVVDFVNQIAAAQSADAKETLNNILSQKAMEALDGKKQEIASSLFNGVEAQPEEEPTEDDVDVEVQDTADTEVDETEYSEEE